jgi:hypothetical protein
VTQYQQIHSATPVATPTIPTTANTRARKRTRNSNLFFVHLCRGGPIPTNVLSNIGNNTNNTNNSHGKSKIKNDKLKFVFHSLM